MKTLFELNSIIDNDVKQWYELFIKENATHTDVYKSTGIFTLDPYQRLQTIVRNLFSEHNDLQQKLIKAQSELINRITENCDDC